MNSCAGININFISIDDYDHNSPEMTIQSIGQTVNWVHLNLNSSNILEATQSNSGVMSVISVVEHHVQGAS